MKSKKPGEYRNLVKDGLWTFEVRTKSGWINLGGLCGEVSEADAQVFAQKTADYWRKK